MELQPSALYANLLKDLRHEFTFSEYRGYHESGIRYFDGCERSLRPRKVAALALSKSFLKKFQDDADGEAESRALLEFLERNSECEKWTLQLETDRDKELYGTLRKVLDDFFIPTVYRSYHQTFLALRRAESDLVPARVRTPRAFLISSLVDP